MVHAQAGKWRLQWLESEEAKGGKVAIAKAGK